ncbi:prolyl-tRNA synthetase associated domain-containing protein [Clostridium sediminicola]|uniref:prolyl-tRNA synthetase associated domain-containing protein n=1 Tax=Clostridium sediminicola TaxID=3114879 RepID=UPI0031F1EBD4
MKSVRQIVFDYLSDMNITYDIIEHPAVYTIEEMDNLSIDTNNQVVKNLFVRDDKKKRYFLIAVQKDKRVNLKELKTKLNCRPLSFASESALDEILGLNKGAVTPFGILNDTKCKVEVVLDNDVRYFHHIGIHPNDNTATVWIKPEDLEAVIKKHGNEFSYVEI